MKIGKVFLKIKRKSFQKLKLHPSKTQKFKSIIKLLIYTDTIDNKSYFLTLKAYRIDNLELNVIKAIQNPIRYDKFIIGESNNSKHLIGFYCKLSKTDEVANILNEAHAVLKGYFNGRSTADYIQTILHCCWQNIYLDCEQY